MITTDKNTEIFYIADDFCKEFQAELGNQVKPQTPTAKTRNISGEHYRLYKAQWEFICKSLKSKASPVI
jgi:hypothetical protein